MKHLTNGELHKIEREIEEIDETIELCDADRDADVLEHLESRLEELILILEQSMELAKRAERNAVSPLKLVGDL